MKPQEIRENFSLGNFSYLDSHPKHVFIYTV